MDEFGAGTLSLCRVSDGAAHEVCKPSVNKSNKGVKTFISHQKRKTFVILKCCFSLSRKMREISTVRRESVRLIENAWVSREMRETWQVCMGCAPGPRWGLCPQIPVIDSCSALAMVAPNHSHLLLPMILAPRGPHLFWQVYAYEYVNDWNLILANWFTVGRALVSWPAFAFGRICFRFCLEKKGPRWNVYAKNVVNVR